MLLDAVHAVQQPLGADASTLSSKGQIVIPKEIRDELQWKAGAELTLSSSASGVTLKAKPKNTGRNLVDLIGMLKHVSGVVKARHFED